MRASAACERRRQEARDFLRIDVAGVDTPVGMIGGSRPQEDSPEREIVAALIPREPGLQLRRADITAGWLIGALHELAQPEKRPGLVAVEGAFGRAHLRIATALDGIAGSR